MKTRSGTFFSTQAPPKKRKNTRFPIFDMLPREIWLEIAKNLDKHSFRELASTSQLLNELFSDHSIFAGLPWPVLDYEKQFSGTALRKAFQWENGVSDDNGKPGVFILPNGDVGVGVADGAFSLLRFGDEEWRLLGKHTQKTMDGRLKHFKITEVILLDSGDIASCAIDGIRIWDRKLAKEKYQIVLPGYSALSARPCSLIQLSKTELACSCVDGSVHLLRIMQDETRSKFVYQYAFPLNEKYKAYLLKKLTSYQDELIAEYSHFIIRWNWKSGEVVERIYLSDLKAKLADMLIARWGGNKFSTFSMSNFDNRLKNVEQLNLSFNWDFPYGYVQVVMGDKYAFLLSIVNPAVPILLLGDKKYVQLRVTNTNDISLFDRVWGEIFWKWDPKKNEFNCQSVVKVEARYVNFKLMPDGNLLMYQEKNNNVWIYDRMADERRLLKLETPQGGDYNGVYKLIPGYLTGCDDEKTFYIWDIETGRLLYKHHNVGLFMKNLPSGDLLETKIRTDLNGYYESKYTGIYAGSEELVVYRFRIKK